MPMSDYPLVRQLHADRTARIVSEHRLLRLPTMSVRSRLHRKAQRRAVARLATTC